MVSNVASPASLSSDLACAFDPVRLARRAGIEPDAWQREVLRSSASQVILCCSRQSGKSTVTSILALHQALYTPDSLVLVLSPSQRQSGELFKKIMVAYRLLDRPVTSESETALTLTLSNGSRIVSLPGSTDATIRGYSGVNLLCVDEAAWVPDSLYLSIRPMLAVSGGRLLALSTPNGTRGWYYAAWKEGENWERYKVPAALCPRISPQFLAEEERAMGWQMFMQEYNCEFADAQSQAFRREDVDNAFREEVAPWDL